MRELRHRAIRWAAFGAAAGLAACAAPPAPQMPAGFEQAMAQVTASLPPEQRAQLEEMIALGRQGRHAEAAERAEALQGQVRAFEREMLPLARSFEAESHDYVYEPQQALFRQPLLVETALTRGRLKRTGDLAMATRDLRETLELARVRGDAAQEEAFLRRVLAERERMHGPAHAEVAVALHELAVYYRRTLRLDDSMALFERALAIHAQPGGAPADVASTLSEMAAVHLARGDARRALPLLERALALREALGADHPHHAAGLANLGVVREALGDVPAAEAQYMKALARYERLLTRPSGPFGPLGPLGALGPSRPSGPSGPSGSSGLAAPAGHDDPDLAHAASIVLSNAGLLAWKRGDLGRAAASFARALLARINRGVQAARDR